MPTRQSPVLSRRSNERHRGQPSHHANRATAKAEPGESSCPLCSDPVTEGQRLALVRLVTLGHAWVHLRHLGQVDPTVPAPDAHALEAP